MFELLTRLLLWVLIGIILWYVFQKLIPRVYLTWLGGTILFVSILLAFRNPDDRLISAAWSIISFPLKPLGLTLTLLGTALRKGLKSVDSRQVLTATLVLWLTSTPLVSYWASYRIELSLQQDYGCCQIRINDELPEEPVRAIVVLGNRVSPDGFETDSIQFLSGDDNIGSALRSQLSYGVDLYYRVLYEQGSRPYVIVSTDLPTEAQQENVRGILSARGVADEDVVVEADDVSLRTSAVNVATRFKNSEGSIILIAPMIYLTRAYGTFRQRFAEEQLKLVVYGDSPTLRNGSDEVQELDIRVSDLIPSVQGLGLMTNIVEEWLTSIYYFLRGWSILG
jgi:hypothetical protein